MLAGKNVYDVVQQTNKPPVAGIVRGGWLEDASRLKSSCSSLLPSWIKHLCAEGRPGAFAMVIVKVLVWVPWARARAGGGTASPGRAVTGAAPGCWAAQPASVTRCAWGMQWVCCGWNSGLLDAFLGLWTTRPFFYPP